MMFFLKNVQNFRLNKVPTKLIPESTKLDQKYSNIMQSITMNSLVALMIIAFSSSLLELTDASFFLLKSSCISCSLLK